VIRGAVLLSCQLGERQRVARWRCAAQEPNLVGREAVEVEDDVLQLDLQATGLGENRRDQGHLPLVLLTNFT
jgi:hypothetical protein